MCEREVDTDRLNTTVARHVFSMTHARTNTLFFNYTHNKHCCSDGVTKEAEESLLLGDGEEGAEGADGDVKTIN